MVIERIARSLRLGKWKHFAGYDLSGNRFFELPHPLNPGAVKRTVEYKEKKDWNEYKFDDIPVQWSAWMRGTRKDAPTLQELEKDALRRQRLQMNVAKIEAAYQAEKAQEQWEAEQVAQLDAPRRKQAQQSLLGTNEDKKEQTRPKVQSQETPYPSHANPAIVPDSTTNHPPSQEAGASIPKATPQPDVFPGIAQTSPERKDMAAALDEAAELNLGKKKKAAQAKGGKVKQVQASKATAPKAQPKVKSKAVSTPGPKEQPQTVPEEKFEPESWQPKARRR